MRRSTLALFLIAFLSLAAPAEPLLAGPRELFTLSTEWFDISFPAECRSDAVELASYADSLYAKIAGKLGGKPDRRFVVAMTADYDELNGFFTSYPFNLIALYRASPGMGGTHALIDDPLRSLFLHELTHAVTLTSRSPFWDFWAGLFGDPCTPLSFIADSGIAEGATVSFESDGKGGRVNDPYAMAYVWQDILEGKALPFRKTTGILDVYPWGIVRYHYSGAFAAFLQRAYGEERYAALWETMGKGNVLANVDGGFFMPGAFETVYGKRAEALWEEFLADFRMRAPVVTATDPIPPFRKAPGYVTSLVSRGTWLYWIDLARRKAVSYDTASGATADLFDCDGTENGLDVSADGKRFLVSGAEVLPGGVGFTRYRIREFDSRSGVWKDLGLKGFREAKYAGDSILGIKVEGYSASLAMAERSGAIRMLAKGSGKVAFGSPAWDGDSAYALMNDCSVFSIIRVDLASLAAERLDPGASATFPRYLSSTGDGGISFSVSSYPGLARAAFVRDGALRVQLSELSGGSLMPVVAGGKAFRVGRFSDGQKVCSIPEGVLAFDEAPVAWIPLPALVGDDGPAAALDENLLSKIQPYNPLEILLPRLWYPAFRFASETALAPSAYGLHLAGADRFGMNSWDFEVLWNHEWAIPEASFRLTSGDLSFGISDSVRVFSGGAYRLSQARLALDVPFRLATALDRLTVSASASAGGVAPDDGAAFAPFLAWNWAYSELAATGFLSLGLDHGASSLFKRAWKDAWYLEIGLDADSGLLPTPEIPRLSLAGKAGFSLGPLSVKAWGDWSADGRTVFAPAWRSRLDSAFVGAASLRRPAYLEYSGSGLYAEAYAYAEARLSAFAVEVQEELFGTPLYLKWCGLDLGYRAAMAGWTYLHSAYARLWAGPGVNVGMLSRSAFPHAYFELNVALSDDSRVGWTFGLSTRM